MHYPKKSKPKKQEQITQEASWVVRFKQFKELVDNLKFAREIIDIFEFIRQLDWKEYSDQLISWTQHIIEFIGNCF